jgi:hypothetical protein
MQGIVESAFRLTGRAFLGYVPLDHALIILLRTKRSTRNDAADHLVREMIPVSLPGYAAPMSCKMQDISSALRETRVLRGERGSLPSFISRILDLMQMSFFAFRHSELGSWPKRFSPQLWD